MPKFVQDILVVVVLIAAHVVGSLIFWWITE